MISYAQLRNEWWRKGMIMIKEQIWFYVMVTLILAQVAYKYFTGV